MIDFDATVHQSIAAAFGQTVTYRPVVSDPDAAAFTLTAIFDRHHEIVLKEIRSSEINGPGHSTTAPVLAVRRALLTADPEQGDEVDIGAETFSVWDVQPDGRGMIDLVLREVIVP